MTNYSQIASRLFAGSIAILLLTGCTHTSLKTTGTQGLEYHVQYRLADGQEPTSLPGKIPGKSLIWGFGFGSVRLEECEYLKADTNGLLAVEIRTHRFRGTATSPPGTLGVRVTRNGQSYHVETF
jgi:hypothetical protein